MLLVRVFWRKIFSQMLVLRLWVYIASLMTFYKMYFLFLKVFLWNSFHYIFVSLFIFFLFLLENWTEKVFTSNVLISDTNFDRVKLVTQMLMMFLMWLQNCHLPFFFFLGYWNCFVVQYLNSVLGTFFSLYLFIIIMHYEFLLWTKIKYACLYTYGRHNKTPEFG